MSIIILDGFVRLDNMLPLNLIICLYYSIIRYLIDIFSFCWGGRKFD
jgi:hypothetical protein